MADPHAEHQTIEGELTASDLSSIRGDRLLFNKIGFSLSEGNLVHVTGPNGSGKTTLLRILCNLGWPETGEVFWGNQAIRRSEDFKNQFIYIGHHNGLKAELSLTENLQIYSHMWGAYAGNVVDAVQRMGLDGYQNLLTGKLSAGQRRRAALSRLLLARRRLWILDEPFTSLDSDGCQAIEHLMEDHLDNHGMIILTSHQSLSSEKIKNSREELSLSR